MQKNPWDYLPPHILQNLKSLDLKIADLNVHEPIDLLLEKTVLMGGKRLRPLMTLLFCDFVSLDAATSRTLAWSIEYVHAASLAHDDVVDGATSRRGFPSINMVEGNKKAVLAGDYLLAQVIVDLSKLGNLKLVSFMAEIIQSLAVGEWVQYDLIQNKNYTSEQIENVATKKTSSVMSWCSAAPFVQSDASDELILLAKEFGKHLGLAFQLIDDTLDFDEHSAKDMYLDVKNSLLNSVTFDYLEREKLMDKFRQGEKLESLLDFDKLKLSCEIIRKKALEHLNQSRVLLEQMIAHLKLDPQKAVPIEFLLNYLENRRS